MTLGALLERLRERVGEFELLHHWQQGEFHHDVVIRMKTGVVVAATNCNGGVKEVLLFDDEPERLALWHWRCPENPEFEGELPPIVDQARTAHWFDPCQLLTEDARSELKEEHRERQPGGGWMAIK